MKYYEGMFLVKPDLSKGDLDKLLSQIQEIIGKHKGFLEETKEWGKQKIAYPIMKYKEGFYYLINFHIDSDAISKIKRAFSLNESILRVLIVRA